MVDDWVIKTMYATKRRRKNPKSAKPLGLGSRHDQNAKSNPSKRHRERLNSELEHLASLLPFEQNVIVKLDKLSILRLAVSYLRMKSYFQAFSHERVLTENRLVSHLYPCHLDLTRIEGEACLQAFNGFIFIMSCDGEVFCVSKTVENYLGFHQADILHQSILELIHSEDREEFRRQLSWRSKLPAELQSCTVNDLISRPELAQYLKRRFTVRFRCLLDNTSGFITLELNGRLQCIYGQTKPKHPAHTNTSMLRPIVGATSSSTNAGYSCKQANMLQMAPPAMGMFVICSPLGPVPSLSGSQRDVTFKTKHQLNLSVLSVDARARTLLQYADSDLQRFKVYDLVHPEDLAYVARGHREVFQAGSIGLLVHRWLNKSGEWVWLQSRLKLVLKNGKHDHIIAIHRKLSYAEGMDMLSRRTDEYKLPFPLLEPETLLNEDGTTTADQPAPVYNSGLMSNSRKEAEFSYLGSVINSTVLDRQFRNGATQPVFSNEENYSLLQFSPSLRNKAATDSETGGNFPGIIARNCSFDYTKMQSPLKAKGKQTNRMTTTRKKKYHHGENRMCPKDSGFTEHGRNPSHAKAGPISYLQSQQEWTASINNNNNTKLDYFWSKPDRYLNAGIDRRYVTHPLNLNSADNEVHWQPHNAFSRLQVPQSSEPILGNFFKNSELTDYTGWQNGSAYPLTYDAYAIAAAAMVAAASGCQPQQTRNTETSLQESEDSLLQRYCRLTQMQHTGSTSQNQFNVFEQLGNQHNFTVGNFEYNKHMEENEKSYEFCSNSLAVGKPNSSDRIHAEFTDSLRLGGFSADNGETSKLCSDFKWYPDNPSLHPPNIDQSNCDIHPLSSENPADSASTSLDTDQHIGSQFASFIDAGAMPTTKNYASYWPHGIPTMKCPTKENLLIESNFSFTKEGNKETNVQTNEIQNTPSSTMFKEYFSTNFPNATTQTFAKQFEKSSDKSDTQKTKSPPDSAELDTELLGTNDRTRIKKNSRYYSLDEVYSQHPDGPQISVTKLPIPPESSAGMAYREGLLSST